MNAFMKHIEYIKNYPYWEKFKRETWYIFHPISHTIDAYRYFKSGNEEDRDRSYNNRNEKGKK